MKGKSGMILFEESEITNQWKELLKHLYGEEEDSNIQLEEVDRLNTVGED
jgi:hypothetical protein